MALHSNNIKENLMKLEATEGFIGAALADSDSGMCLGFLGGAGVLNMELAAASNAEVVRSKRKAEDLISRFTASGQTNIYPALQMAYRMLVDAPAKSKHVILLSDGDTQPADFQRLAKRMADVKITVTTVAIGAEADRTLLENISTWGKGRFYYTESAERVPQIFIEETRKLVNENVREEPFRPAVKHKAEALRGIDLAQAPMLKGFASTKAKPRAEVTLTAGKDAPLLSRWQIGLGKAVVFGSDLKNRWAADWLTWPGYAKFWSQIVRESMRRTLREDVQFRVRQEAGQAVVTLDALTPDGQFRNGLAPKVSLSGVADLPSPVTLRQSGPGRYEVRVPLGDRPAGVVRASLSGGVPADVAARAGVAELAARHFNLLETLGEYIIALMLDEFGAPWVKISIAKIGIMKGVRRVGVQIERSRG